jgi:hypothetical protein
MQDRPTADEVLTTLRDYLQGEVLPNVDGTLRYHTLVAANLVTMLQRELQLYPGAASAEQRRLGELLGRPDAELADLNDDLAERLRKGDGDTRFERRCWEALFPGTLDKLAISKPGYDSYDMADEVQR